MHLHYQRKLFRLFVPVVVAVFLTSATLAVIPLFQRPQAFDPVFRDELGGAIVSREVTEPACCGYNYVLMSGTHTYLTTTDPRAAVEEALKGSEFSYTLDEDGCFVATSSAGLSQSYPTEVHIEPTRDNHFEVTAVFNHCGSPSLLDFLPF